MTSTLISHLFPNAVPLRDNPNWKQFSSQIFSDNSEIFQRLIQSQTRLEAVLVEEVIAFSEYNQLCQEKEELLSKINSENQIDLTPEEEGINQEILKILKVIHQLKLEHHQAQTEVDYLLNLAKL
jgi:hypothetical protein